MHRRCAKTRTGGTRSLRSEIVQRRYDLLITIRLCKKAPTLREFVVAEIKQPQCIIS